MKNNVYLIALLLITMFTACTNSPKTEPENNFNFELEKFADLRILRYQVPGFDELSLKQKELIYYLSQAAVCGRDILWDQNGKYNLAIRKTLENIYLTYSGDKQSADYANFLVYIKRVEFSNGIYHHYSSDKIVPDFSKEYFKDLVAKSDAAGFPVAPGKNLDEADRAELDAILAGVEPFFKV